MSEVNNFKTIVISDVHLGSQWSKTREVTRFLKNNTCETLILCGDIIDGWCLRRGQSGKWRKRHSNFIKLLLDLQYTTEIIYVRGNHDDFLDRIIPLTFQNIQLVRDYVYTSNDKKFFVLHGDVFDSITTKLSWLAHLGDIGYTFLLWFNKYYNYRRVKKGLPYYSLAKEIKERIKISVSYISDFEKHLVKVAHDNKCDGVICGHIHHPDIRYYDDVLYLNSGDWVESLSALTEDYEGNWNIYNYK